MPAKRPHRCRQCGALDEEGHHISLNALCEKCGQENFDAVVRQLRAKEGPVYNLWKKRRDPAWRRAVYGDPEAGPEP